MAKKQTDKKENEIDSAAQPEEKIENVAKEVGSEAEPASKGEDELKKALTLAEDYKRKWYAVSAEYDNFRKRNSAAVSKAYADGAAEAVLKLLPVADNFGYALDSASDEKTKAGIDKVIKSFLNILQSMGIEEIKIEAGDPFDEGVAEAVMSLPCGEGEAPNVVKQVLKKGYRAGEKVIRFAQVAVTIE